jgi:hypothetical protein
LRVIAMTRRDGECDRWMSATGWRSGSRSSDRVFERSPDPGGRRRLPASESHPRTATALKTLARVYLERVGDRSARREDRRLFES